MQVLWTHPVEGATLNELIEAAGETETIILNRLRTLIKIHGGSSKGGLFLRQGETRQIDIDRLNSDIFENYLLTNF